MTRNDSRRPAGRAGTHPAGPAGVSPGPRTILAVMCNCEEHDCPCKTAHLTEICACCRAGYHDQRCNPT